MPETAMFALILEKEDHFCATDAKERVQVCCRAVFLSLIVGVS